jgi:hypothetical protein
MIVKLYSSLTKKEVHEFYQFCHEISIMSTDPAAKNMWGNTADTLIYILEKGNRFKYPNGDFFILYDGSTIIACGGVYISNFSPRVAIGGVRTWVAKEYRNSSLLREYILPAHKAWCQEKNIDIIALTFNEYNKNLIQVFKRKRLGETLDRISSRMPHHLFYSGLNEVPFALTIQYTKQWAIYERLSDWDFDWNILKVM